MRRCSITTSQSYPEMGRLVLARFSHQLMQQLGKGPLAMAGGNSLCTSSGLQLVKQAGAINRASTSRTTAVQISWAEQRRLLKTREKASPKGCSGDQVAADKIEIMLLSQLGLHSRQ